MLTKDEQGGTYNELTILSENKISAREFASIRVDAPTSIAVQLDPAGDKMHWGGSAHRARPGQRPRLYGHTGVGFQSKWGIPTFVAGGNVSWRGSMITLTE